MSKRADSPFLPAYARGMFKPLFLFIGLIITLTACAALQNREAIETERLLSAAGFRIRLADTPEKLDHLKDLTQRKLVQHERNGRVYYIYADAQHCKCLYAGNEEAYQRYQKLALDKQIAEDRRMAAEMNEDAAMKWGLWGPWGPRVPWD